MHQAEEKAPDPADSPEGGGQQDGLPIAPAFLPPDVSDDQLSPDGNHLPATITSDGSNAPTTSSPPAINVTIVPVSKECKLLNQINLFIN